jgi:NADPH:quinone reductase-like Zn-dependent oxidoreductase
MKAIRIGGYGAAPAVDAVAMPAIGPEDVLVRIAAASLNPLDVKLLGGVMHAVFPLTFPYTAGTDLSGTVERVGTDVTRWREGDRVIARLDPTLGGALAEYAAVPAALLAPAPATIALADAAGIPTAAGTAWQALFETARLQPGHSLLVHAGVGGVGSFAIQLARKAGARVIATASGNGIAIAHRLGADQVIDYRAEDFTGLAGIDVVLDTVGGPTLAASFGVLQPGGTLITLPQPVDDPRATFVHHQSDGGRLRWIGARIDECGLAVLVDRRAGLDDIAAAYARQASGRARGKIILQPGPADRP